MIQVIEVGKSFNDAQVLRSVAFEVSKGDFVAVMGASGSGKSTLLYSVSGMDTITSGKVMFDEVNLAELQEEELSTFRLNRMGFVFQNPQMLKNLTVFDNIILPGLVAKQESAETIRARATTLMQRMDIAGIGERDIREVSGGQLQRAAICRSMINKPEILFLDEPTGALNSEATDEVLAILEDLNREGMTIMMVTHDSRVAARAHRVLYMRDGEIAANMVLTDASNRLQELDSWLQGISPKNKAKTELHQRVM